MSRQVPTLTRITVAKTLEGAEEGLLSLAIQVRLEQLPGIIPIQTRTVNGPADLIVISLK